MRIGAMLLGLAVVASARPAAAGRGAFGWLVDSSVNPERIVELESWVFETNGADDGAVHEDYLWWGPTIGVTDRVELSLPIELSWTRGDAGGDGFTFERFGAEVRWRLVSADPVEAPAVAPLVRFAAKRIVGDRARVQLEADAVASYDAGRVHVVANAGVVAKVGEASSVGFVGGAGAMIRAVEDLQLGAELTIYEPIKDDPEEWIAVGPGLSWTHGRFWLSASIPIGITGVSTLPRLRWGVAF